MRRRRVRAPEERPSGQKGGPGEPSPGSLGAHEGLSHGGALAAPRLHPLPPPPRRGEEPACSRRAGDRPQEAPQARS